MGQLNPVTMDKTSSRVIMALSVQKHPHCVGKEKSRGNDEVFEPKMTAA
jgi:hypothetical protein